VDLRVEARPISAPIQAFVKVTDANGAPVAGLNEGNFTVTLDGVVIQQPDFTLPPAQNPSQRVSVVFAMDYSESVVANARAAMESAVTTFISTMKPGDFAAIIKFNRSNPLKASVVCPFTQIDGAAGTIALINAVTTDYPGNGTNLLDAIKVAIGQFTDHPALLPAGPKAVIVVTDGGENSSVTPEATVIINANAASIPIFTVGVGTILLPDLMDRLAAETGGEFLPAPNDPAIAAAYVTISELLNNEYLLTIQSSISDCGEHTLEVSVTGQTTPASAAFVRCSPPAPPPPPPAAPSPSGGGGGAVGVVELFVGLVALVARRRRRV
jgi:VWFA-related protein